LRSGIIRATPYDGAPVRALNAAFHPKYFASSIKRQDKKSSFVHNDKLRFIFPILVLRLIDVLEYKMNIFH